MQDQKVPMCALLIALSFLHYAILVSFLSMSKITVFRCEIFEIISIPIEFRGRKICLTDVH